MKEKAPGVQKEDDWSITGECSRADAVRARRAIKRRFPVLCRIVTDPKK